MSLLNLLFATTPSEKTCGCASLWEIRGLVTTIWSVITIIQYAIPIILIILGMLDLGKAVAAGEEKEIKESQKLLMKRALSAVAVFFVIAIVQLVLRLIPSSSGSGLNVAVCREGDILIPSPTYACECKAEKNGKINIDSYVINKDEFDEAKAKEKHSAVDLKDFDIYKDNCPHKINK
ncbi:MAG: hypothetical protein WDA21_04170 [Bacilli bacterium]